jgi:death-on-curing protein
MHAALTGGAHRLARQAELESAVGQPMQTWGGAFLYPSLYLMAGVLLRSLAENQPFTDGNKRVAWAATIVFLDVNGITVETTESAVVDLMLKVSAKKLDVAEIAGFLERNTS